MRADTTPLPVEEILAEARFVRRLARKLVRDDATADDLAQETMVAALRRGPGEPGRLRPWLAHVLANFARQDRRGSARRLEREWRAAKPEALPPADEAAQRLEAQRGLVEALEALEEPYRSTVVLRYLEGHSAAAIARRQGVPAGTVRWRLARGLDELRARLDRRFGDRRTWCLAFFPLLRRPPIAATIAASAPVLEGVFVMGTAAKVAGVAVLVIATSAGWWWVTRGAERGPTSPGARVGTEAAGPASGLASGSDLAPPPGGPGRETLAVAPPISSEPLGADPILSGRLVARFVDRSGRPVAGVRLTFPEASEPASAVSDANGRVTLETVIQRDPWHASYEASCPRFATLFGAVDLDRGRTCHLGDLVLDPGGAVAGIVFGPDESPFAGAEVQVTRPDLPDGAEVHRRRGPGHRRGALRGRTGSDGRFLVDGAPASLLRVWAGGEGLRYEFTDPVEVRAHTVCDGLVIRLALLDARDFIAGQVLAPDGSPVPEAMVTVTYQTESTGGVDLPATLDAEGRFHRRLEALVPYEIRASDRRKRWPEVAATGVQPGTVDVVLRFSEQRWMEVIAREEGGVPLTSFRAGAGTADGKRGWPSVEGASGKARIPLPAEPFLLKVSARGHAPRHLGPWSNEAAPGSVECELARLPGIRGRVTAGGEPLAGASLSLFHLAGPDDRVEINGFASRLFNGEADKTLSGADGGFEMWADRREKYALLCEAPGWALAELSPLDLDPDRALEGLEIRLVRGGSIEGRVLERDGHDPSGLIVAVNRGDSKPRTLRVGPEGAYRFDGLTPGPWHLYRALGEFRPSHGLHQSNAWRTDAQLTQVSNCSVEEGRVTRFDLDLMQAQSCVLLGQISVNGRPAAGWTALLRPEATLAGFEAPVDTEGRLHMDLPWPGRSWACLKPPAAGRDEPYFWTWLDLRPGQNPWPVDLATGILKGRCRAAGSERVLLRYEAGEEPGFRAGGMFWTEAGGAFSLPHALAGKWRITQVVEDGSGASRSVERDVDVPSGGTAEIELP